MSASLFSMASIAILAVPSHVDAQSAFPPPQLAIAYNITSPLEPGLPQSTTPSVPPQPGQLRNPRHDQSDSNSAFELPNTVSAPPFTVGDKFYYRIVQTFGLRGFLGAFVAASIGQASGTPGAWGGGVGGYAERYASAFGGNLSRQSMAWALESTLHEDPRYFPSEQSPFKLRVLNSFKQVFATKTDSGHSQFAYGRVVSAFAAGQLVNAWQPSSNATVADGLERGVYSLGADFAYNLTQEFFSFTRPSSMRHRH